MGGGVEKFTESDFGLTELSGTFLNEDWGYGGVKEQVVLHFLTPGQGFQIGLRRRQAAEALRLDVAAMLASPLEDRQIELLWTLATDGCYGFRSDESGRDFLNAVHAVCVQWQELHGAVSLNSEANLTSPEVLECVLSLIAGTPLIFPAGFRAERQPAVGESRIALDECARSISAEFAFRFLLRIHMGSGIPVDRSWWGRYQEAARMLSLGEFVIEPVESFVH